MKKVQSVWIAVVLILGAFVPAAMAAGNLVQFDGGIGVDPVAGIANNAPVLNVVRGVNPGGRPWVIARLKADVKEDGRISVSGEGLLLAGGDGIGTTGGIAQVVATLFCGTPPAFTPFKSPTATFEANGNFVIGGQLNSVPPNPCDSPVLLVGKPDNDGNLAAWFAAGIPKD